MSLSPRTARRGPGPSPWHAYRGRGGSAGVIQSCGSPRLCMGSRSRLSTQPPYRAHVLSSRRLPDLTTVIGSHWAVHGLQVGSLLAGLWPLARCQTTCVSCPLVGGRLPRSLALSRPGAPSAPVGPRQAHPHRYSFVAICPSLPTSRHSAPHQVAPPLGTTTPGHLSVRSTVVHRPGTVTRYRPPCCCPSCSPT